MRSLPVLPTLRGFQPSWLGQDVLGGLTLVAIAVPEQMATARLAGMTATAGLYAFVAGSVLFALLGLDRQMSVGADSTIAPVMSTAIVALAALGSPRYVHLVSLLAVMTGVVLVAVGLLRLGWIAEFLSTPVVTGLLAGIAVEIVVRQLPVVLGLASGGSSTIGRLAKVAGEIGHVNGFSAAIAATVLAAVVVAEHLDRRIPAALVGLVVSTLAVGAFGLASRGVAVLGTVHSGLPTAGLPTATWGEARHLIVPALTIAFICVAQTAATARAAGGGGPSTADFNRDLVALGTGSVAAGLIGSFAVDASPPRTEIVRVSGGRTQLTGLVASGVVLAVVLLATGLLKDLPDATLGAILLFVASRLFRLRDFHSIQRFDRLELALALVTLAVVTLLGIEEGIIVAILLSLADRTRQAARPRDVVLGRETGTAHWIPPDVGRPTEQVPGVLVYLVYAPLWYGNADAVVLRVRNLIDEATEPVHTLVLDANGMSDIDYTGAQKLGQLATELQARGVTTAIARSSHLVRHDLVHSGLLADIGPEHLFSSVEEAIEALTDGTRRGGAAGSGAADHRRNTETGGHP